MTSNELRIGNFIQKGSSLWKVTIGDLYNIEAKHKPNRYNPIQLTDEWLLKAGFKKQSNNSWQLDTKFGFSIWGRVSHGFWLFIKSDDCGNSFKHVHQLQNLYFALTGEELTLNEPL